MCFAGNNLSPHRSDGEEPLIKRRAWPGGGKRFGKSWQQDNVNRIIKIITIKYKKKNRLGPVFNDPYKHPKTRHLLTLFLFTFVKQIAHHYLVNQLQSLKTEFKPSKTRTQCLFSSFEPFGCLCIN